MPPKKKSPSASRKRPAAATSPKKSRTNANKTTTSSSFNNNNSSSDINQHHHHHHHRIRGNAADIASQEPCQVADMFQTNETKPRHKNGTNTERYLDVTSFPSYVEDDIWAILQECGFKYQGGFRCAEMDITAPSFDHEDQVRQHLCLHGLPPSIKHVQEADDAMLLQKWVAFAQVPMKESDAPERLAKLPLPSDYQALVWLGRLGFLIDGETKQIYRTRPLADGVDEFSSVEQVRAYVRSVGNDALLANAENEDVYSPRKRARRTTRKDDMPLEETEFVALRLWAALSPTPLPIFGEKTITITCNSAANAASGSGGASASAKKNKMDIDDDDDDEEEEEEEEEEIEDTKRQARASTKSAGPTPVATQNQDANSSNIEERPPSQASSGSLCVIL